MTIVVATVLVAVLCFSRAMGDNTNITYVTGTCTKTSASFNMSSYYNQNAMLVTDFTNVDVSGDNWDLGQNGAYKGYNVMLCAFTPTSYGAYPSAGLISLIQQKGFSVTQSCDMAGILSYPRFHVYMMFDRIEYVVTSDADVTAIANFYKAGGGLYIATDNCPYNTNANKMYNVFPSPLDKFRVHFNNGITPFPLTYGNPVGSNQFGNHPAFTGVPQMSSGHSLTIPMYNGAFGVGPFAIMCTVVINRVPIPCSDSPPSSFVYSHASVMYINPLVQLWNISGACNWGRIIHDTAWTRYGVAPTRTGSWRLAANGVVWLLNIERLVERNSTIGNPYGSITCGANTTSNATDQTQVVGCSSGDAVTLKSPAMMCRVSFAGDSGSAPSCLALVVSATGETTCVVNLGTATVGTYWIIVDGKNTSLTFSVTAASLTPRGTVVGVSGTCVKASDTSVSGCTDGSTVVIDWTLPYPTSMTLGLGSTASVCRTFTVSGTQVTCTFKGLNTLARGTYQSYINGVSTGIQVRVLTDIAAMNKVLCSRTHSPSLQASSQVSLTSTMTMSDKETATMTVLPTPTHTPRPTLTPTQAASSTATGTQSLTASNVLTVTNSPPRTLSPSTVRSSTTTRTWTLSTPRSKSTSNSPTSTGSGTVTFTLTQSSSVSTSPPASRSASQTSSVTVSGTVSLTATRSLTTTKTITGSPVTLTADDTGTLTLTSTAGITRTDVVLITASPMGSATEGKTASGNLSGTRSVTGTRRWRGLSPSHSAAVSVSRVASASRATVTQTQTIRSTPTPTWACVNATELAAVLAPYVAAALEVSMNDADVRNGSMATVELPPIDGLDEAALHVPWFQPVTVSVSVRVLSAPNQRGFVLWPGRTAGISVMFPRGLGSPIVEDASAQKGPVPAFVVVPPLSGYTIYAAESVMLEMRLMDATLGFLCGGSSSADVTVDLIKLNVLVDENALLAAAQQAVGPVVAIVGAAVPFAAPDIQSLVMVALMPCASSYQRRTYAMFRALSLFTLDDSYEGVLWGNLMANVLGLGVHAAAVVGVAVVQRIPLTEATIVARFPGLYLSLLWQLTFSSNLFASLQLLSDGSTSGGSLALGALVLSGFCVGVPVVLAAYVLRKVDAHFRVYEYHKWRRSETALRVRLLSTMLLPVGRWEPVEVRRRMGAIVTLQCRPEFYWMLLPLASPVVIALFSLARNQSERVCVWLYVVLACLHVLLMAVIVICKPLRSRLEDWFSFGALGITAIYLACSAINLAYPPEAAVQGLLACAAVAQMVLLLVRLVYHVVHVFLARRLAGVVPSRVLFEWNRGVATVDDAATGSAAGGAIGRHSLHDELDELLLQEDVDVREEDNLLLELHPLKEVEEDEEAVALQRLLANTEKPLTAPDPEPDDDVDLLFGLR